MGHGLVVFDLFEDLVNVDGVVEALVVEAWRAHRGEAGGCCCCCCSGGGCHAG